MQTKETVMSNIESMAKDYVKQVYPNNPHPVQVDESE